MDCDEIKRVSPKRGQFLDPETASDPEPASRSFDTRLARAYEKIIALPEVQAIHFIPENNSGINDEACFWEKEKSELPNLGSLLTREQFSAKVSRVCEKLAARPDLEVRPFILKGGYKIGDDSCSWEERMIDSSAPRLIDRAIQEERELRKIRDAIRDDRLTSE